MIRSTTIWVEILPDQWPDWTDQPYGVKVGRIRKRAPKPEDRDRFTPVRLDVDAAARYGTRRVEL